MNLVDSDVWAQSPPRPQAFLITPYFPRDGIVLLYGKKGRGKSPLIWHLARSVATGEPWLDVPVQTTGRVLYIEADTPSSLVYPRAHSVLTCPNVSICFTSAANLCSNTQANANLRNLTAHLQPVLVIVNTLRKIHPWDDKVSETCQRVYGAFQEMYPDSCIVFVHHEKKDPIDAAQKAADGEEFSGSLAWYNDCQVALRLARVQGKPRQTGPRRELQLTQTASQIARAPEPIYLKLNEEATGFEIIP